MTVMLPESLNVPVMPSSADAPMLTAPELVALPMTPKLVGANTLPVRFRMPELVSEPASIKPPGCTSKSPALFRFPCTVRAAVAPFAPADTVTVPPPSLMSAPALSFA